MTPALLRKVPIAVPTQEEEEMPYDTVTPATPDESFYIEIAQVNDKAGKNIEILERDIESLSTQLGQWRRVRDATMIAMQAIRPDAPYTDSSPMVSDPAREKAPTMADRIV